MKILRGAAAVKAVMEYRKCHCGYTWEGMISRLEPEDLPDIYSCRFGSELQPYGS